jgi:hypothetical protein
MLRFSSRTVAFDVELSLEDEYVCDVDDA